MKLYDAVIREAEEILSGTCPAVSPYDTSHVWKDVGEPRLIMKRDAAFELGGAGLPSVNLTAVTTSGVVTADEVRVYGPDLTELKDDAAFARIVLLETEDLGEETDSEKAFAAVRNIDFVRYHVNPLGYMVRVSAASNEEQVRVDRRAVKAGIRFAYVGGTYIKQYRRLPEVKHVRVIFVTEKDLVEKLVPLAGKVDAITRTLTHILDGLPTDCGHCAMKAVCDEVEGMRELHLGKRR